MTPQLLASPTGTHWTNEELDNLRKWTAEGVDREEQATRLGRSKHAVGRKLRELKLIPVAGTWWRKPEINRLKRMVKAKTKVAEIARKLKRTPRSVRVKIEQLKLLPPIPYWTDEEHQKLREWAAQEVPIKEQAEKLGRPVPAVRDKISRLGLGKDRTWKPEEDAKLRELHQKGYNNRAKATALKRTYQAVKRRVRDLGLGRGPVNPWSEEEIQHLKKWVAENELRKVIARRLGRCQSVVKDKITELGIARPYEAHPWTADEEKTIRALKADGVKIKEMARVLKRSKPEVRGKLARLGLVKKRRPGWTTKELDQIRRWIDENVPGPEQARRLGRTYPSWFGAVKRFKLRDEPYSRYDPDLRIRVIDLIQQGLTQKQMAAKMGKTGSTISSVVRELEKKGIVGRVKKRGPYFVTKAWTG